MMSVLSIVEAQFTLHKHNITKEPRNANNPAASYEPADVRNSTVLLYSVSHKRAETMY